MEQLKLSYITSGSIKSCNYFRKIYPLIIRLISNKFWVFTQKRWKYMSTKKDTNKNVHSSIMQNSQTGNSPNVYQQKSY